jgi:hypothetical protein
MLQLVVGEHLLLALDQLHYYTHWITPEANPVRFDTRFFVARHPSGQEASPDLKETTDGAWIAPRPALEANIRGTIPLSPPTLKTLEDVSRFDTLDSFLDSLRGEGRKPPVLPVLVIVAQVQSAKFLPAPLMAAPPRPPTTQPASFTGEGSGFRSSSEYQFAFIHIASLPAEARLRRTNSTPPSLQDAPLSLSSWSPGAPNRRLGRIFECELVSDIRPQTLDRMAVMFGDCGTSYLDKE